MCLAAGVSARAGDEAYDEANNRIVGAPSSYIVTRAGYAMGEIPAS